MFTFHGGLYLESPVFKIFSNIHKRVTKCAVGNSQWTKSGVRVIAALLVENKEFLEGGYLCSIKEMISHSQHCVLSDRNCSTAAFKTLLRGMNFQE